MRKRHGKPLQTKAFMFRLCIELWIKCYLIVQIKEFYTQNFSNVRENYIEAISAFTHHRLVRESVSLRTSAQRRPSGQVLNAGLSGCRPVASSDEISAAAVCGLFPIRVGASPGTASRLVLARRADIGGQAVPTARGPFDRMVSFGGLTKETSSGVPPFASRHRAGERDRV